MTTLLDQLNANNPPPRNTTIKHEVGVKEDTLQTVLGTIGKVSHEFSPAGPEAWPTEVVKLSS